MAQALQQSASQGSSSSSITVAPEHRWVGSPKMEMPTSRFAALMAHEAEIERRIAAMKQLVCRHHPCSSSEALRLLNAHFPGSSLQERIRAIHPETD